MPPAALAEASPAANLSRPLFGSPPIGAAMFYRHFSAGHSRFRRFSAKLVSAFLRADFAPIAACCWCQRSAFLSAGVPTLRACKRGSYFDLILRGHGGNDPGEGTIKARHLQ